MSGRTIHAGDAVSRDDVAGISGAVHWRCIFENSSECMAFLASDGTLIELNSAARELLGIPEHELGQRSIASVLQGELLDALPKAGLHVRTSGSAVLGTDSATARELEYWIVADIAPSTYLFVARDVTERNNLRRQLHQSQCMEAIGRLASGIAHDFNNMLTVVMGYGELLATKLGTGHALHRYAAGIMQAAERSSKLSRQLLDLGRDKPGAANLVDVNATVRELQPLFERLIGENIRISAVLDPAVKQVRVDPVQFSQVLMNLVVNARDAMEHGGHLHIETACAFLDDCYCSSHAGTTPGKYVMISVTDTGCGFTPDLRTRIFEPFFTTKEKNKGSGLGLATVQRVVRESGGHIWLYSEPGQGSTFKLYLPTDGPQESSATHHSTAIGRGQLILLIEDDDGGRDLLSESLLEHGYKVIAARGGEETLNMCAERADPVQLVLSDVLMTGTNGQDLSAYLACRYPDAKMLYMSGFPPQVLTERGLINQEAIVLQKPFRIADLLERIGALL